MIEIGEKVRSVHTGDLGVVVGGGVEKEGMGERVWRVKFPWLGGATMNVRESYLSVGVREEEPS